MTDKLKEYFDEMIVNKNQKENSSIADLNLPSFMRDWVVKQFEDEDGHVNPDELREYVHTYIPDKDQWVSIKDRIVKDGEEVKILTKIAADISIDTGEVSFELPDFGLKNQKTIIEDDVWRQCRSELSTGQAVWGVVTLGYHYGTGGKDAGKICLLDFKSFCPYTIDLDYYKDARKAFTTSEWIDVLLGAIDYNAAGYDNEEQKLTMLSRLLPFIEKNLNLIELAPKGTGKSYVFGHISKYGMLTEGKVTRAKMFYDAGSRKPGFIMGHDYVAIDEVKLVQFNDVNEMRSVMQDYMEYGKFNISGYDGVSDAGIIFLGNISQDNMDEYKNMLTELPSLFQESALVDRIHGFIKGWDIPRMNDDLKMSGWALNSEYFCAIMHELRSDISYRSIVDRIVEVPDKADTRDTEAIKKITTAFLKLLFPNVRKPQDVNLMEFNQYCLRPAVRMRKIIRKQLAILDKEYSGDVPTFTLREISDEN